MFVVTNNNNKHSKIWLGEFVINDSDDCLGLLKRLMT